MRLSGMLSVLSFVKPARLTNPSGISSLGTIPDGAPIILLTISSAAASNSSRSKGVMRFNADCLILS